MPDTRRETTYNVVISVEDDGDPGFNCTLLSIGNGQLHLHSDRWIEPGYRIAARFDRITLKGTVTYSKRRIEGYLTCVDVSTESAQLRREPRLPIDIPGKVILLSDSGTSVIPGMVKDISNSGLGLRIPSEVQISSIVCVETARMLIVGEVRHCRLTEMGDFSVGILLTDVFSDQTEPPRRSSNALMKTTRKLRQAFLGGSERTQGE